MLAGAILSLFMNDIAAIAVLLPATMGLAITNATGNDPRILLMVITLGCSLVFPTPIGLPVNVIVMGSDGYTFKDFLRLGWLLVL